MTQSTAAPSAASASPSSSRPAAADAHRHRLLEGMAAAVAELGYADTTIAEIVRHAGVSRRTFYEHFATKAECLVALYDAASHQALKLLQGAIDPALPWQAQIDGAMTAYLGCLAQSPVLLRTLFIDIMAIGEAGLAARRRVSREIAEFIVQVAQRDTSAHTAPFTADLAMAVVGGIHELVLQAIEEGRAASLADVVAPACLLVRAVAGRHT